MGCPVLHAGLSNSLLIKAYWRFGCSVGRATFAVHGVVTICRAPSDWSRGGTDGNRLGGHRVRHVPLAPHGDGVS